MPRTSTTRIFHRHTDGVGTLSLRPFDPGSDSDAATLHSWVVQPYARFWGMGEASVDDVRRDYRAITESAHHDAFVGERDGEPRFLAERYDPVHAPVGRTYDPQPGDVGMHLLVGPPAQRVPGFTTAVFRTVMDFLFADDEARRVVVEPDARNDKILRLNERLGFRRERVVTLPDKQAWLSLCTRRQYADAIRLLDA